jgi:ABC-type oligopeptide transport system substrate-binding subunit
MCVAPPFEIADPLGQLASFRMNHLHPPFNDVRARCAILMALSQEDYMRACVGDDKSAGQYGLKCSPATSTDAAVK